MTKLMKQTQYYWLCCQQIRSGKHHDILNGQSGLEELLNQKPKTAALKELTEAAYLHAYELERRARVNDPWMRQIDAIRRTSKKEA